MFKKRDIFLNHLMKYYFNKRRLDYYSLNDLIALDTYLYDIYEMHRPFFFTQLLLDKLESQQDPASNELL